MSGIEHSAWNWLIAFSPAALTAAVALYQVRVWRSVKKFDRLFALSARERWKHAGPMGLQIATAHAFGRDIDDRIVETAFRRHNPKPLLRTCALAGVLIKPKDGLIVDARDNPRWSCRTIANALFGLGLIPYVAFLLASPLLTRIVPPESMLVTLIVLLMTCPTLVWISLPYDAAARVLKHLDQRHPLWEVAPHPPQLISAPNEETDNDVCIPLLRADRLRTRNVADNNPAS